MNNVIDLKLPYRQRSKPARQSALLRCFSNARRGADDVFWMKENAEVLNVLESTQASAAGLDLSPYEAFYATIEDRIGFFPQYYRFFLSICLDLEDMGMPGEKGTILAEWVRREGLPNAEISDLQRAEARRLCLRRGIDPLEADDGLDDRLRDFMRRSRTFALPNKKAAYELTHIVFYLSEYGRRDPKICAESVESLKFAGTLAFLELNIDLLSEVCIALRFAGCQVPEIWEKWLSEQARRFIVEAVETVPGHDDYHPWLMLNWFMSVADKGGFAAEIPESATCFTAPRLATGPLRELSNSIFEMGERRKNDWREVRGQVGEVLSDEAQQVLTAAEAAIDFGSFFRGFSRSALPGQAH